MVVINENILYSNCKQVALQRSGNFCQSRECNKQIECLGSDKGELLCGYCQQFADF